MGQAGGVVCRGVATRVVSWPSGLRRQFKALVRKGVGSNPTLAISFSAPTYIRHAAAACPGAILLPRSARRALQQSIYPLLVTIRHPDVIRSTTIMLVQRPDQCAGWLPNEGGVPGKGCVVCAGVGATLLRPHGRG